MCTIAIRCGGQLVRAVRSSQTGLPFCCRYVPGAKHMNVNSGVQIRQLLFPDSCDGPVKSFKTLNPDYDPTLKPRPQEVY